MANYIESSEYQGLDPILEVSYEKVDGWKLKNHVFLPFDDFLDFREMKFSKLKVRISTFYMYNEDCGQNKSCRGRQTI